MSTIVLGELLAELRSAVSLLQDPHPGLSTWQEACTRRMDRLAAMIEERVEEPKPETPILVVEAGAWYRTRKGEVVQLRRRADGGFYALFTSYAYPFVVCYLATGEQVFSGETLHAERLERDLVERLPEQPSDAEVVYAAFCERFGFSLGGNWHQLQPAVRHSLPHLIAIARETIKPELQYAIERADRAEQRSERADRQLDLSAASERADRAEQRANQLEQDLRALEVEHSTQHDDWVNRVAKFNEGFVEKVEQANARAEKAEKEVQSLQQRLSTLLDLVEEALPGITSEQQEQLRQEQQKDEDVTRLREKLAEAYRTAEGCPVPPELVPESMRTMPRPVTVRKPLGRSPISAAARKMINPLAPANPVLMPAAVAHRIEDAPYMRPLSPEQLKDCEWYLRRDRGVIQLLDRRQYTYKEHIVNLTDGGKAEEGNSNADLVARLSKGIGYTIVEVAK